jgi:hypothetical protein
LFWNKVQGADKYEVIKVFSDNTGETVAVSSESSVIFSNLEADEEHLFVVRSLNANDTSEVTYFVNAYTHRQVRPLAANGIEPKIINLSFSGKLPATRIDPGYFLLKSESGKNEFIPVSAITATDTNVVLHFQESLPPGNYKLRIASFPDYYKTPTTEDILPVEVKMQPEQPLELYLARISVVGNGQLLLSYSEPVEIEPAENIVNYSLSPFGKVAKVTRNSNESEVTLFLDPAFKLEALGRDYLLTVTNVIAQSTRQMTKGAGSTIGFVFSKESSNEAFVYPNPARLSEKPEIFFANLSQNAEVFIMTLDGKLLRRLTETDGNGGVEWDGRDDAGQELDSGIYLFRVKTKSPDGAELESDLKKFAIIR